MFCQLGECNTNCPQPCNNTHISNNLLPQYHTQYSTIHNPNQNPLIDHNHAESTLMSKHKNKKLGTSSIQQILNNKETTRKDFHQKKTKKEKISMQMDTPQQHHIHLVAPRKSTIPIQ
jgi:hypothetical protein